MEQLSGSRWTRIVESAGELVVGLDFDGVLAPIVDDPERAVIHHRAPALLARLGARVRAIAVITGRPAGQALALGGLEAVGEQVRASGGVLRVLGQYGNERWSSEEPVVVTPDPPAGVAALLDELPALLADADASGAWVEEKGLAVGVHTRRLQDGAAAYDRLEGPLREAAERHGLHLEPGRMVLELRAPGADKGDAVREAVTDHDAGAVLYAGDDLGDVPAFDAVEALAGEQHLPGFLVCSGSGEQQALVGRADVVVEGPDGVMDLLERLAEAIGA
ncbi:trehalose-phosphatase [Nocardioidaceae bacterium]|nr:trehalose-phosphatase [Nocardioidaceae bacterium]